MNIPRPCIDCGRVTHGSRCPEHQRITNRKYAGKYSPQERDRMRRAVQDWIARKGPLCMGYKRRAHWSRDLSADHILPISQGGEGGPLRVLCESCNKRRGGEQRGGHRVRRDREGKRGPQVF